MTKTLIARWESKSGKHWVELERYGDTDGYTYHSPGSGGVFYVASIQEAFNFIHAKLEKNLFQPGKNKTPMRRVK